jgi:citrate synthase
MGSDRDEVYIQSRIWLEEPEPHNPFATRAAYCHGYDVYGEMLGKSGWVDMLFLLFRGEAPSPSQKSMLEILAVALANPGPRDASVHAAMCGGVGGSSAAASLMAALAVGAGSLGGSREIALAMEAWVVCDKNMNAWREHLAKPLDETSVVWPAIQHRAGFDPHGTSTSTPVKQTLARLAELDAASRLAWLSANLSALEQASGHPLSLSGVAAASLSDLGFDPPEGEMISLLLRLPGAAAHALEQRGLGYQRFPWYQIRLEEDHAGEKP